MAAADFNSSSLSINQPCKCYKVPSLDGTILDANEISSLNDRYVLGEQLGWGQFGVIRACTDRFTGELLACKSIAKDRLVTADDVRSVKHEIEIMTRLSGLPNVVDLKAVYEDWDYVHLVMELCAGGELFLLLEKHGRFSEFEARFIFRQLMQVVSYCHEIGIVHRDLKPENILLATKTSSSSIKLADFGLATYIKKGQSLHGTVGSPFYIAPEVLSGGYNEAADVWSTGVILYILLSGMPPFWGKTKSRIFDSVRAADLNFPSDPWDQINESAKDLIRGMLCIDPLQRLTAQQVLGHSWMKDDEQFPGVPSNSKKQVCSEWEFGGGSFSLYMSRDQDISFGKESPVISDVHSPTFTCRSSCVSCHDEPFTTPGVSDGFSFPSTDNTNALELSSGLSSMPSFAFFSPGPLIDQGSCKLDHLSNSSGIDSVLEEASLDKVIMTRESSLCCGREAQKAENKPVDVKRAGGNLASRMFGIQSKRNRTIGFGEREQLDIMATESVIRWASCTNLPTTSSLRSSLVC